MREHVNLFTKIAAMKFHIRPLRLRIPIMNDQTKHPLLVGITGASGALLAGRFLRILKEEKIPMRIIISQWAEEVALSETGQSWSDLLADLNLKSFRRDWTDLSADIASGSFPSEGMVILPCSMGTLGGIAAGISRNLIERAADVMLKERKPLVLVPRETPLNTIHIKNMLRLSEAGAIIMPPMFSFYTNPENIPEMIDQFAYRILKCLGIESDGLKIWNPEIAGR